MAQRDDMATMLGLSQWSSGISLTWALLSLAVGGLILAVIAVRLWGDHRKQTAKHKPTEPRDEEISDTAPQ